MYKSIRKKLAESISIVDSPEHYDWNKWLREPSSQEYYLERVSSAILDTKYIVLESPVPTTRGFSFDLPKIKISKAFKQLYIHKQKTNKVFFSFPKTNLNAIKEILTLSEITFSLSVSDSGSGSVFRLKDGKSKSVSEMTSEVFTRKFNLAAPGVFNLPLLLPLEEIFSMDTGINKKVEVYDLLSNLKTEVINVELLNSENFVDPIKYSEGKEIKFQPLTKSASVKKVAVVQLEKLLHSIKDQKKLIKNVVFTQLSSSNISAVSEIILPSVVKNKLKIMSVKNVKIPSAKLKQLIKIDNKAFPEQDHFLFRSKQDEIIGEPQDALLGDLEVILQPIISFGKEEKEKIYPFLYDYQMPAADFLSENKIVLLNDELGTGKTLEAAGALKILFRKKDISNVIIVCSKEEAGWEKRNPELSNDSMAGWYDHLKEYTPGISLQIIANGSEVEWKKPSAIKITNYEIFSEALEKKLISMDDLNRRGCLIIDEVEDFPEIKLDVLPKYLWMLSGLPADELKDKISTITGSEEQLVSFGRTKEDLLKSLPFKMKQDYWLEMEPGQKTEYSKALNSGREKIYDLVQAGNPFLVQSNVFTLVHQLTQIGNFYGKTESSPKSELLLHHVKTIKKSGKKVLVFSQYDRQGTQKLQKLFAKNGIKYVLYQTGISLKEMEDAIKRFEKDKSVTVFLAGMKATSAKLNLTNVPYLIHFDQWWSPVTTWQAEDRINSSLDETSNERMNVYNYFIRNSIEEKIRLKLIEKGLNNKKLFDLLNSDLVYSLISNEDWLELLELIEPKDEKSNKTMKDMHLQYVVNLTTDDFAHKIKALFGRIGYKNISLKTSFNPDEARLFGMATKNSYELKAAVQCLNMKFVPKKIVKDFVDPLVKGTDRIFIFSTGEFDESLTKNIDDERLVLIDKHQVSNYLYLFNLI